MVSFQQKIYDRAPWTMKEALVMLEALRRNRLRRWGDYTGVRASYNFEHYSNLTTDEIQAEQLEKLRSLMKHARQQSPYYAFLPDQILSLDDLHRIPVLTKMIVHEHLGAMVGHGTNPRDLWKVRTSGSTGTPLPFYQVREGIRARFAIQDEYYAIFDCHYGQRRVRFGGNHIAPPEQQKPPFWILNRIDRQLQMSPYHLSRATLPLYVEKLNNFKPRYLTGYAHALYILGEYLAENGGLQFPVQAVFTDSEGIAQDCVRVMEQSFGKVIHDIYGLGEVGWVAVQCPYGRYHTLDRSCIVEILDDEGNLLPQGQMGRLIVTDLTQSAVPYIRYDTGDLGTFADYACECGWHTRILESLDGRADDILVTPSGRRVPRVSVTRVGHGILESQLAQVSPNHVIIRIVPAKGFEPRSMDEVLEYTRKILGNEMQISWEIVESIPRTTRHKFRHIVREFDK